jgi:hypothetical protein
VQVVFSALCSKAKHHQTDRAFDEQCRFNHDLLLGEGNLYPASYYMMKRLADVR